MNHPFLPGPTEETRILQDWDLIQSWEILFHEYQESDSIQTGDHCCLADADDDYTLDVIVTTTAHTKPQKIIVSADTVEESATTIRGLLHLLARDKDSIQEVTFQCFARQPRQNFPTIPTATANLPSLQFRYFHIDTATTQALFSDNRLTLVQCTVDDYAIQAVPQLVVSCTKDEFQQLAPELAQATAESVELLLHFWLDGEGLTKLLQALRQNRTMKHLKLRYLELPDAGWQDLCQALTRTHLQTLELGFTDNFVDNTRRLTPERRVERTRAIQALVEDNPYVRRIVWPECQQDAPGMEVIQALLDERTESSI